MVTKSFFIAILIVSFLIENLLITIVNAGISQPTYVNMHELASMAANKAQTQDPINLPPPPAEFTTPSNEKVQLFTSPKAFC